MMSGVLREWVLGIVGAALLTAISMAVTPESKVKKIVGLACGAVMAVMLVKPIIELDYSGLVPDADGLRREAAAMSGEMLDLNEKLSGVIIEEQCAAYILDKGTALGIGDLKVTVAVELSGEGYWYPAAVSIKTDAEAELRDKLGGIITDDLGIAPEEIGWSVIND